jgi:hypothetical protein
LIAFGAHLEDQGLDPLTADIWAEFVGAVVHALLVAKAELKASEAWAEFCAAVGAFGKPRKRGPHRSRCLPTEEGISGELVDRMNDFLRSTGDDHVLRKWHVTFESEGRIRSKRRKCKYAARTDIRARAQKLDGPEFVLEAKLVDTVGDVRRRLLGSKGLGCFIADEPYTTGNFGGLLAYTVRGDTGSWLERIERAYTTLPELARATDRVLIEPSNVVAVCAVVERTHEPIWMLNLVLKFATKAS